MKIRKAEKQDSALIFECIMELAIFEKGEKNVINSPEQIEKDGFGENPLFHCLIGEVEGKAVGISLYYYRYSTWKGKILFLEDLIIIEGYRGHGYGTQLLDYTISIAKKEDCKGIRWQVLDWNTEAIDFYKKYDVELDEEWIDVKKFF